MTEKHGREDLWAPTWKVGTWVWTLYQTDILISVDEWEDGERHGLQRLYWPTNRMKCEVMWVNGEMDRETHRYFPLVEDTYRPDGWGHTEDDYPHTVAGLARLMDGYPGTP